MKTKIWAMTMLVTAIGVAATFANAQETETAPFLKLGDAMPKFTLKDVVTDQEVSSDTMAAKKVKVVISMCRHCPYVKHVMDGLIKFGNDYADKDVSIVGISANDAEAYPADAPASLKEMAVEKKLPFPLLYDETQRVAKAFTFACTPEFFVFDEKNVLRYRGQFDDSHPRNEKTTPVTGKDVRAAVDALLEGKQVSTDQKHAIGCSIKWKDEKNAIPR